MDSLKISLITPSFNQGQYIDQTISSVIDQEYPNLEYIIIDGGSDDKTLDVIKKHDNKLAYWVSEKDNGQSNAINKGLQKATGDIVNWLNSDDYYEPDTLQHVAKVFSNKNVMGYSGISRIFGGKKEYFSKGTDIYPGNLHKTIGWARIDQPETFFRRSAIEAIGHLNEELHYVMDRDLWIRYLCKFGLTCFVKDEKLLVHFRLHDKSKTVSQQSEFNAEQRSLFYTYADIYGLTEYKTIFPDLFPVKILPLTYYSNDLPAEDWEKVLNYFLLRECLEAYAQTDYLLANAVLKWVKKQWLHKPESDELFRVQMRLKLLPPRIKKIWNRIRY
jgi:glycosyltransferase involved in cell wall biosynthesis